MVVASESVVTAQEPVIATLTIFNRTDKGVTIDLGQDATENIAIDVIAPGKRRYRSQIPVRDGFQRAGRISISPGGRYTQRLLLNDWIDFSELGQYELSVQVIGRSDGASKALQRETLTIAVLPRDPLKLQSSCSQLAQSIVSTDDVGARLFNAKALASIIDPVAVTCIEEVLAKSSRDDARLLDTLGRIGTPEAIAALERATTSINSERAEPEMR
jgi:hypothetical protein